LNNIPFPYTPECFSGRWKEARNRRIRGDFSTYDYSKMERTAGRYSTSMFGSKQFAAEDKALVRATWTVETATAW
jgi:hypothetical protein